MIHSHGQDELINMQLKSNDTQDRIWNNLNFISCYCFIQALTN